MRRNVDVAKPKPPPTATDDEVRVLLQRYQCPVPFHAVRTRFLGNIATPAMQAAPMETVSALWGGELPAFDTLDAANELIGALVMGLWNRLSRHQERSAPFRLTRVDVSVTREGLAELALMRQEELDGFTEGLFGAQDPRFSGARPQGAWRAGGNPCDAGRCSRSRQQSKQAGDAGGHHRNARPSSRIHADCGA
jgi:hypothetical protein